MRLRPATPEDARVLSAIHRLAAFLPPLHSAEDDLRFVREWLMRENQIWVAEAGDAVVGYIAFNARWIHHLFVHPEHQERSTSRHHQLLRSPRDRSGRRRAVSDHCHPERAQHPPTSGETGTRRDLPVPPA
ncbi:MAG: GNAT family N-acetyltransferase [Chloroflexi bacterium]|nr:GNAT family N-acetyltransferase [Chloroflexota bacterium]